MVKTPSGRQAEVVAIYPEVREVLVQWSTGERARFKFACVHRVEKEA